MTDADGEPITFNKREPQAFGVLAAAPGIHAAAVAHFATRVRKARGW